VGSNDWISDRARRLGEAAELVLAVFSGRANRGLDDAAQEEALDEAHKAVDAYSLAPPEERFLAADVLAESFEALFDWASCGDRSDMDSGETFWLVLRMAAIQFRERVESGPE
jgi:hypothetical protein